MLREGDRILIVDDVIATFTSKATAIAQVEAEAASRGVRVEIVGVAVVVDRGAKSRPPTPVPVTSALILREELSALRRAGATPREVEVIQRYLDAPHDFQEPGVRSRLEQEALMARSYRTPDST